MIKKVCRNEKPKELIPVTEEELDSAYGCECFYCKTTIRSSLMRCCYKDCYNIAKGKWTKAISTAQ